MWVSKIGFAFVGVITVIVAFAFIIITGNLITEDPDDDTISDDHEFSDDCVIGLQIAYSCQLVMTDKDGDWTLEDAIVVCQNDDSETQCLASCALDLRDNDCPEIASCFNRFCPNSDMTVCFKKTETTKTKPTATIPKKLL